MGTRADFYVGRGKEAEWLASIALDGYPDNIDQSVLHATTESAFKGALNLFLKDREDATRPEQGWPWPWDDSRTTDYAYAFDPSAGIVYASRFGSEWFVATEEEPEDPEDPDKTAMFPNMKTLRNVTLGPRSGLIIF